MYPANFPPCPLNRTDVREWQMFSVMWSSGPAILVAESWGGRKMLFLKEKANIYSVFGLDDYTWNFYSRKGGQSSQTGKTVLKNPGKKKGGPYGPKRILFLWDGDFHNLTKIKLNERVKSEISKAHRVICTENSQRRQDFGIIYATCQGCTAHYTYSVQIWGMFSVHHRLTGKELENQSWHAK